MEQFIRKVANNSDMCRGSDFVRVPILYQQAHLDGSIDATHPDRRYSRIDVTSIEQLLHG